MAFLILLGVAFLIGSIPFAVLVSKAFRLGDPRQYGSGNPGATNVLRSGNKKAALLTLLGDAAKGWIVVFLAQHWASPLALTSLHVALLALAVFLGHVYSVFLRFKGGKGVATALGVLLGLHWLLAGAVLLVWITVAASTRYSSLAAICAAIAAPFAAYLLHLGSDCEYVLVPMAAVLLWRHRANIARLLNGTEGRIGARAG